MIFGLKTKKYIFISNKLKQTQNKPNMILNATQKRRVKRLYADEKKLKEEYDSSFYSIGTYDDVMEVGDVNIPDSIKLIQKVSKLTKRFIKASDEGLIVLEEIKSAEPEPEPEEEPEAPESEEEPEAPPFSQGLYGALAEKYAETSQFFKFKNESRIKFIRRIVAENQSEIALVGAVRNTILQLYDDIDISDYDPSQTDLNQFNSRPMDISHDLETQKRELVKLKREIERERGNYEKIAHAQTEVLIKAINKKEKKKAPKMTLPQIEAKLAKVKKDFHAHLLTREKQKTDDDLILYGVNLQALKSLGKQLRSEKKYFGRDRMKEQRDARKEKRDREKEAILNKSEEWLPSELTESTESDFLEARYIKAKKKAVAPRETRTLSSSEVFNIKILLNNYLTDIGHNELFEELDTKAERFERFSKITRSISKSKAPKYSIIADTAVEAPECVKSIIHTLYNEWKARERMNAKF